MSAGASRARTADAYKPGGTSGGYRAAVLLVGLTGGIGSGKSTVAELLAQRGAVIVDADAILAEIRRPGGAAHEAIVERFGTTAVAPDGTFNLGALAAMGNEDDSRAELRDLTYPHLDRVIAERIGSARDTDNTVVLDVIPRLAEGGRSAYDLAGVIVVDVPVEESVRRLVTQRGWSEDHARARIASQMSREARRAMADFVIDNSGAVEGLAGQVQALWAWLLRLRDRANPG